MTGVSKLYCGTVEAGDALRYGLRSGPHPGDLLRYSGAKMPVVVWNCTRCCNLKCIHCYAHAGHSRSADELTFDEGRELIDDLAGLGVPVLLFSGGEPLCRADVPDLAEYAVAKGLRAVLSTNGTRLTHSFAGRLKAIGLSYVGISLDGMRGTNDRFRGQEGAFDQALEGVRACRRIGLKVGLRFTVTRYNVQDLPSIFDLLEAESIPRVCFYHLVPGGRGKDIANDGLTHAQTRCALDLIMDSTARLHARGLHKEVLTVDNHCDGPYIHLRLRREGRPEAAARAMELLAMNGGNGSGLGIGCVSWDGTVYPDQFLRDYPLGNVREQPFSAIWTDTGNALLTELRDKPAHVTGKCVNCRFLAVCGGNFRARAVAASGQFWGVDPACYLTDEEIA